jgi:hypothetical protein
MTDVTQILNRIEQGDASAPEQLLPLVSDELRCLAATRMAQEAAGHALQVTALVHEAYLKLVAARRRHLLVTGDTFCCRSHCDESDPCGPCSREANGKGGGDL